MEVDHLVVLVMQKRDIKKCDYDVAVIGGGPAGMMAAITSSEKEAKVILIEKNNSLGRKLLLTGGGRCNISNAEFDLRKLVSGYNRGGEFLFYAFSIFGAQKTLDFFKKIKVETKIEKNKKVFPMSDSAKEVLESLENKIKKNGVEIIYGSSVSDIEVRNKKIESIILKDKKGNDKEIIAKSYIFCTGGKSYPITGSNGLSSLLIERIGHKTIESLPALSPVNIKNEWIKELKGISMKDVRISFLVNNKKISAEEGEIIFTHFGLSGPAILNISGHINRAIAEKKDNLKIKIDFFPKLNQEQVLSELEDITKRYRNRTFKNILSFFFQKN